MNIITANCVFDGFYDWGPGWTDPKAEAAWRKYWDGFDNCHSGLWKHFRDRDCDYLVSVCGCAYLHPMNFDVVLQQFTKPMLDEGGRVVNNSYIDALAAVCSDCAEKVGGTFEMRNVKYHHVDA